MEKKKILFVCFGNVARSQMAEAFYNKISNSKNAMSAGVADFTPAKYGVPIKEVVDVMSEENIDVSTQKVKYITPEMVKNANKIYIMCKKEDCPEFLLDSKNITFWKIKDPYGKGLDYFREIRDQIKRNIIEIL